MKIAYDIVIVGGGMVGAALACALGDSALKVAVLDHKPVMPPPPTGYDLRVSAITLAARAIFENLGAWEGMSQRRISVVNEMHVWDQGGTGAVQFNAADIGQPCLAYIIENSVIQAALVERLHQFTNVHHLCPVEVTDIVLTDTEASVILRDGRHLRARLLVGADGADSRVRQAAGIGTQRLNLEQTGIVATVTTEKLHEHIARQRFLSTGPLAFLPLGEPNTCSIVWSTQTARADQLLVASDEVFVAELQTAFGDSLGGITSISPRAGFPLALSHAKTYTAPRVALIGDAAHTVHPLAGQGVNLGFLDAAALAEVLLEAVAGKKDIGAHPVLRRYERWRKADNLVTVSVTGGFRFLFGNDLPIVSPLRNFGLDFTNAVTPVKNFIMRRASGISGDLPRLARPAPVARAGR
jgi:2-octaprenylphenol hydroxylase